MKSMCMGEYLIKSSTVDVVIEQSPHPYDMPKRETHWGGGGGGGGGNHSHSASYQGSVLAWNAIILRPVLRAHVQNI